MPSIIEGDFGPVTDAEGRPLTKDPVIDRSSRFFGDTDASRSGNQGSATDNPSGIVVEKVSNGAQTIK